MLTFSKKKSAVQVDCLQQILRGSSWKNYPNLPSEMVKVAQVATAVLNDKGRTDYIYLLEDGIEWCGTAGCKLLIAEKWRDGNCNLLYEAAGDTSFTALRHRDHGYRRIYTPCEARFDGRQYQKLREDCPNLDVPR